MKAYYRLDLYDDGKIELEKTTKEEYDSWENHRCCFLREKGRGISIFGVSLKDCYKKVKSNIIKKIENKRNEIKELEALLSKIETNEGLEYGKVK